MHLRPATVAPRFRQHVSAGIPRGFGRLLVVTLCLLSLAASLAEPLTLHTRQRVPVPGSSNDCQVVHGTNDWDPSRTAIVVCDMWDRHWCPDATARVGEMAPVINRVLLEARRRGVFVIHCPSDTMGFYKDHPGRLLAQAAPKVETKVPLQGWCSLQGQKEPPLPIDDTDGGCDGCPDCPSYRAWERQHPALEIVEGDAITDSVEAFYLMRQRGITNVIVLGVHENMCVLGRPFSIRQMVAQGQNVVLMRDMTDSMYNHRQRPYVSHFVGTDLVCEHIEKYWCPSITSADFLGGEPFRFREDRRKRLVMITGENEYGTAESLAEFARNELAWRGHEIAWVQAPVQAGDSGFTNMAAIEGADAILISVRRRTPPVAMMAALRRHVAAGKAVVGIRTASHAFDAQPSEEGYAAWSSFDDEVLGADYQGHYGNASPPGPGTALSPVRANALHVVLTGVPLAEFSATSHLYKYRNPAPAVRVLWEGRAGDGAERQPVAWVNEAEGRRVFYVSLGSRDDFKLAPFRRLLLNGILWALNEPIPPAPPRKLDPPQVVPTPEPAPAAQPASSPPAGASSAAARQALDLPQEAKSPPLTPAEAAHRFQVADDLEWEQVLAEPIIAQPVFLNFDERGRMWVVEYRQYPWPAGLRLVSRDGFWRNVYDKVPPPPPHHVRGADRISIHEDTDGDGTYEKHSVFVDGLNITTAVERGRGGVWVLNPPYLLFYPDANDDDVPDRDPELRLSGFGIEDTHSVANSLRWGPDGWLYGAQGSTVTSQILTHGSDGKPQNARPIYSQGQNIWRYHPAKRVYEVFAEGGGNAFGCEIDSQGRIFSGHNGGDTRGFHYEQGAYLQKGFEKHGPLSNPYAFGYFPPMPHPNVPRFTHSFLINEGTALPPRCAGHLFGVEPLQGRLVESEILPDGSSFRTRDLDRPVTSDDRWFRPVDIKLGPDGALYVCDWYDVQVSHYRNHEGRMDASNGRVYRLKAKGASLARLPRLDRLPASEVAMLLGHPNRWVRQTALRLLGDQPDASLLPAWRAALPNLTDQVALETLWAIHVVGGLDEATALGALGHAVPSVRRWAVRLVGDERVASPPITSRLADLALRETDLAVRNQLAATAKRLPARDGLAIVQGLVTHDGDAADKRMPLLIWWAIEAQCDSDRDEVLSLLGEPVFWGRPLVRRHLLDRLARRYAATGAHQDLLMCARFFELAPDPDATERLLVGFQEAFRGRPMAGLPEELRRALTRHRGVSLSLRVRQGEREALEQAERMVADENVPRDQRLDLIGVLGEMHQDRVVPALLRVLRGSVGDDGLRLAALLALQTFDHREIGEAVVGLYPRLGAASLPTAQALLTSRLTWARHLTRTIAGKWSTWGSGPLIPADRMPLSVVRKIKQFRDPELKALAEHVWPGVGSPTTEEMERKIAHTAAVVRGGSGDPYAGRTIFQNTCAPCHRLFGSGAEVGPDLTAYKRDDLEIMLLGIINPSAEIREGFEARNAETTDGRSLTGFVVEETPQIIVLRGLDAQNTVVERREISSLEPSSVSIMPEGLLDALEERQIRDLFAYVRSTQPLVGDGPRP